MALVSRSGVAGLYTQEQGSGSLRQCSICYTADCIISTVVVSERNYSTSSGYFVGHLHYDDL